MRGQGPVGARGGAAGGASASDGAGVKARAVPCITQKDLVAAGEVEVAKVTNLTL